ncbi:helix-turn-helix transcriptional regulator [Virgibacillus senegalensis]|uniref:helix-turn-helix transcriptional regulator n=1 Tax=Virgibacillus senegalensis TaxID=1499679 RepID=UPI00069DDF00|nr:helix-turn-helix transcriptional regulator [Virgibacillus senegalensis]
MRIGNKIKLLREVLDLTQAEFVNNICTTTHLSNIENHKYLPSEKFIQQLARKHLVPDTFLSTSPIPITDIEKIIQRISMNKTLESKEEFILHTVLYEDYPTDIYIRATTILLNYYLQREDLKKTEDIYRKSIFLQSEEIQNKALQRYYIICGHLFFYKQNFLNAEHFYTLAKVHHQGDPLIKANIYFNLSLTKQRNNKLSESIIYAYEALKIFESLTDYNGVIECYIKIAVAYTKNGNYKESMEYLNQAQNLIVNNTSSYSIRNLSIIENTKGILHYKTGLNQKALLHFHKSLSLKDEANLDKNKLYTYKTLAEFYIKNADFKKASFYLNVADEQLSTYHLPHLSFEFEGIKCTYYKAIGDLSTYEKNIKTLITLTSDHLVYDLHQKYSIELANYLFENKKYKNAAKLYNSSYSGF